MKENHSYSFLSHIPLLMKEKSHLNVSHMSAHINEMTHYQKINSESFLIFEDLGCRQKRLLKGGEAALMIQI